MSIDLTKFCAADDVRTYLRTPFSYGNYTYATNDHIIVRVDRRPDAPEGNAKHLPQSSVEKALCLDRESVFRRLPILAFPASETTECGHCHGSGHEHDCPDCECECEACDGSGGVLPERSCSIEGINFDAKYIGWIMTLPNIEVETNPKEKLPWKFRFDGDVGALMPLVRSDKVDLGDLDALYAINQGDTK